MFSFRNDPDTDGVGVAFLDAVGPDGARLDLSAGRAHDLELVQEQLGVPLLGVSQVHGNRVVVVSSGSDPQDLAVTRADGMVTGLRRTGLMIRVADCLPVLFADPAAGVVGAAHAGRAGLLDGILVATVDRLRELGAVTIQAWVGPHICGACYEVPEAMQAAFAAVHPEATATTSWGTPSLDLGRAARSQLAELGCTVSCQCSCTRCSPQLHSYRRDAAASGRQAGLIWLP